jgi:hypothetical protein
MNGRRSREDRLSSETVTVGQLLGDFAGDTVTAAERIKKSGGNPLGILVVRGIGVRVAG